MCGIAGIIKLKKNYSCNNKKILELMDNRGPDHKGAFKTLKSDYSINLFHSRLAIIDNNPRSNQPFHFQNFVLIFNGEIYNFNEIKQKLIKFNYNFTTTSDTEVLIKAYHKWGGNCFKMFDGMWAVCIYDTKKNEIILSRDLFGEKPLYIFKNSDTLIFGSEIKYILNLDNNPSIKKINKAHINTFLRQGYKFLFKKNDTYFKNIFKLENGSIQKFSLKNLKLKKKMNINKKKFDETIKISRDDAISKIRELVIKTVESRLISDRPIGFYLSGGIDTGSITSIASKVLNRSIKCFSIIDKDERYNEEKNIDKTADDLKCEVIKIKFPNNKNFLEQLSKLIEYHDKPISTLNYYTHSFLHEHVKKQNIKVLISGLGGDEMFSGYYDHYLMHLRELDKKQYSENLSYWKKYILPYVRNNNFKNLNLFRNKNNRSFMITEFDKIFMRKIFKDKSKLSFHEKNFSKSLLKNRLLNSLFHELVPLINNEDDMNSMRMSIENRSPFLNKELLNFTMSLPVNFFIKNGYGKSLLRESMDGILNNQVRLDRKKHAFNSSIHSLVDLKDKEIIDFFKKSDELNDFVDLKNFITFLKDQKNSDNKNSKLIFSVFNIAIFLKKFY